MSKRKWQLPHVEPFETMDELLCAMALADRMIDDDPTLAWVDRYVALFHRHADILSNKITLDGRRL